VSAITDNCWKEWAKAGLGSTELTNEPTTLPLSAAGSLDLPVRRLGAAAQAPAPPPAPAPPSAPAAPSAAASAVEVSVVMPCLNEADTVATCVRKAVAALASAGIDGEVIVADNGSTDGSQDLARAAGARVVDVTRRGYGAALMGGIAAASGRFVVMGDADDSYDFAEIPKFVEQLRAGRDIVQGCRLPSGGGTIAEGAMPFLHRWWGNPMFSMLTRWWFRAPIHDVYCGMRGFTRAWYERLGQRCTGMEFATEMIIKSARTSARFAEVPITLHKDGRRAHPPHLKTFRDGWRTLRFFLMCSPKWLFLEPGRVLVLLGLIGYALALPGMTVRGVTFDLNTLLFASLALIVGCEAILFAVGTKTFAIREGLMPPDPRVERFFKRFTLERSAALGSAALVTGIGFLAVAVYQWWRVDFGNLDYAVTTRWVITGATLTALGLHAVLASFFLGILRIPHR
jgi:glycosyltransferase involved in cell wall biosynthesis